MTFTSGSSPCAGVVPPEVPSWARVTDGSSVQSATLANSAAPSRLLRRGVLRLHRPSRITHPPPNSTNFVLKTLTFLRTRSGIHQSPFGVLLIGADWQGKLFPTPVKFVPNSPQSLADCVVEVIVRQVAVLSVSLV